MLTPVYRYGHGVLRSPDPRFIALQEFCDKRPELLASPTIQLVKQTYEVAPGVLTEHGKTKNPWPNVDAASGCVLYHYGLTQFKVCPSYPPLPRLTDHFHSTTRSFSVSPEVCLDFCHPISFLMRYSPRMSVAVGLGPRYVPLTPNYNTAVYLNSASPFFSARTPD